MSTEQTNLSSSMKDKIVALFNFLDKDANGEISWSEFVSFQLKSREILKDDWPLDINTIRGEFTDLDLNGDGKIAKDEFVGVLVKYFQQGTPATIVQVVEMIDRVVQVIETTVSVFDAADLDGDGSIDLSEFIE